MNGFSDVRLFLRQEALQRTASTVARAAPDGSGRLGLWYHRWVTRRQLQALSVGELADVGLTQRQQREEGLKPFWRG